MKIGGFGGITDYDKIREAGFDYAELDLPEITELSDIEFQQFRDKVQKTGYPVLTGARALPLQEPWFFTDQYCAADYQAYLEKACQRAKTLGIRKLILGNGKARMLIDETSIQKEQRFFDFMRLFTEIAAKHNLEVILEPLGPRYSNYMNTIPEAVRVIQEVGMPNLFTMADLRHMLGAGESYTDIVTYSHYIHHIHIDYPVSYPARPFPKLEDDFDYTEFLHAIRAADYQDTLTIEADIPKDWKSAYLDAAKVLAAADLISI